MKHSETTLEYWRPFREAHSIERAVIGISFAQKVTDIPFGKILKVAREVTGKLGQFVESQVREVRVEFAVDTGATKQSAARDQGLEFVMHSAPKIVSEKISVLRERIVLETWSYTRWQAFIDRAQRVINGLLPLYAASVPISDISLEYFDRFESTSDASKASDVIKKNEYIAVRAFSDSYPWHSRAGWFEKTDETTLRLTNIDVNVADARIKPDEVRRLIIIRSMMRDTFGMSGFQRPTEEEVTPKLVEDRLEELHVKIKELLEGVLTEATADRIALKE
jgi:uncharacterized protein (TIGR04255 family)